MDFNAAIVAHSEWKRKLKAYLQNPDHSLRSAEVALDSKCELGKWIVGEGRQYASSAVFRNLTAEHTRFHKAAGELVHLANSGQKVNVEAVFAGESEIARATAAVVNALAEMKKHA